MTVDATPPPPPAQPPPPHLPPPELPPGLVAEYLESARSQLGVLAGLAERLFVAASDPAAIDALLRETHKVHGSAGSYGFMEASRLAAGMEATVKDWAARPDEPDVERGSLARWFVKRLAELLGLEVPDPSAPPPAPPPVRSDPPPRVGPPPRPAPRPPTQRPAARPARAAPPALSPKPAEPSVVASAGADQVPEVIYVEDDAALAELLEYGLRAHGYRFLAYRNGRDALRELLALDVQGTHPLLLLDVDLAALVILIILNRWFRVRRSARLQPRRQALDAVMQRWTMGQAPAAEVVQALARLPVSLAVDALVTWSARVPGERWQDLSRVLATQWWARVVRTNNRSARWWKRLECARFLSVAATPHDIGRVLRLLRDDHPAVQIAAATTLERLTSPILVTAALDQLPFLGPTVQAYYASALKKARPAVVRHLQQLFRRPDDPRLPRMIEFAGRLEHPDLRAPFTALATHRDPEVRSQVARALGKYPHADSVAALRLLARDGIWPVRAQAIRSLGMIADPATVQLVRDALRDGDWWVRLRAGLALTRFGASGRNVLLAVEVGAHQPSRDMARLVLGLSPQALAEYAA